MYHQVNRSGCFSASAWTFASCVANSLACPHCRHTTACNAESGGPHCWRPIGCIPIRPPTPRLPTWGPPHNSHRGCRCPRALVPCALDGACSGVGSVMFEIIADECVARLPNEPGQTSTFRGPPADRTSQRAVEGQRHRRRALRQRRDHRPLRGHHAPSRFHGRRSRQPGARSA